MTTVLKRHIFMLVKFITKDVTLYSAIATQCQNTNYRKRKT